MAPKIKKEKRIKMNFEEKCNEPVNIGKARKALNNFISGKPQLVFQFNQMMMIFY